MPAPRSTNPHIPLPLEGRRLLFVGGKGGVGKTTIASALALGMAEGGERVLLVSTDPAHSLGDLFDIRLDDTEKEVLPGLWALEIDPEAEVERYLARVQGTMRSFVPPAMYSEIERQMELTRQSPGAEEAALMDRVAAEMDEGLERYDRVIFDTAPTGHTLRLLALPEIMAAWTDGLLRGRERSDSVGRALARLGERGERGGGGGGGGREGRDSGGVVRSVGAAGDELSMIDQVNETPVDDRSRRIREILLERRRKFARARRLLLDAAATAFVLVLIPEKLPILESMKALEVLRQHRVPVAGIVVNRVLPDRPLGEFLESRRAQEGEYLAQVEREFSGMPRVRVPLMARDVVGVEGVREFARLLARTER
jgi:arsenite-transporting ATPase